MEYTPRALPDRVEELRACANAVMASRAILVGSALREADNGRPVQSYSLFLLPARRGPSTSDAVSHILNTISGGGRITRSFLGNSRYEARLGSGEILNVNFCHRPWMFDADTMSRNVPNGLSQIAMDLFSGAVRATQLYRMDRDEHTITQIVPHGDPDNLVARSVQKRYPTYPIITDVDGRVLVPAPKTKDAAPHA